MSTNKIINEIYPSGCDIKIYFHVIFSSLSGLIPCRSFPEKGSNFGSDDYDVNTMPNNQWVEADDKYIKKAVKFSKKALDNKFGFFVIPGTVANTGEARAKDILEMQTIMVDIDTGNTEEKLEKLKEYIAKPTLIVESGGITEEGYKKLHVYWQFLDKITGKDLQKLSDLRYKLALGIGGDLHFKSLHQPIRVADLYIIRMVPLN